MHIQHKITFTWQEGTYVIGELLDRDILLDFYPLFSKLESSRLIRSHSKIPDGVTVKRLESLAHTMRQICRLLQHTKFLVYLLSCSMMRYIALQNMQVFE